MAIVGIGTDIAEIERVEKVLARSGDTFAERILTPVELAIYRERKQSGRFLAKRFAAKEAAAKALGTGIAQGVTFQDFIITNDEYGKPILTLENKARELAADRAIQAIHLSISDERHYAVATVIYES